MNSCQFWQLPTQRLGRRVLVYEATESTNDRAMELASDPANDGVVILAQAQTAGRGQHGRQWQCGPGDGVLMSVLLFPPPPLRRPVVLAAWAAVSVCAAIRGLTNLEATIKWPNDVLVHGKKVCGILIEQGKGTAAGIGMNVNQSAAVFAAAGLSDAASLACLTGQSLDVSQVAKLLISELDAAYDMLLTGAAPEVERRWRHSLAIVGRIVDVECTERIYRGKVRALSFADVELELSTGNVLHLAPESVRHFRTG